MTEATLVRAVEDGMLVWPATPGISEPLDTPGVSGWITRIVHPFPNLAGGAALSDSDADTAIERVKEAFFRHKVPFCWLVGPSTRPVDMPARLQAHGLTPGIALAGMVRADIATPIAAPPVEVVEIPLEQTADHSDRLAAGFGMPEEVAAFFSAIMTAASPAIRSRVYGVLVPEDPRPVSLGMMTYLPGTRIAMLSGAATLERYRGRGLYTALVARRLADAHTDGCEAAVIQAMRTTSAPICTRLGFQERCSLDLYVGMPPTES